MKLVQLDTGQPLRPCGRHNNNECKGGESQAKYFQAHNAHYVRLPGSGVLPGSHDLPDKLPIQDSNVMSPKEETDGPFGNGYCEATRIYDFFDQE